MNNNFRGVARWGPGVPPLLQAFFEQTTVPIMDGENDMMLW